jgi:hypothetical protein
VRGPCVPGSYSATGAEPCTLADPGYFVDNAQATEQTPCPTGRTSTAGASACTVLLTSTVLTCVPVKLPIGVQTSCTATVTDAVAGSTPAGLVTWTRPSGKGSFSASTCALAGSGSTASCSVSYRPSYAAVGTQTLHATYAGNATHQGSTAAKTITATKRSTRTAISCAKTKLAHGTSTACTAKVSDVSGGVSRAPTGKVRWSVPSTAGALSSATCTLTGKTAVRHCRVTFTARNKIRGTVTLVAAYRGDGNHKPSSREKSLIVT